ncbi:ABC transporter ATP-binding protein [Candidatus Saccharibacteria bacterium]|nr:ABC transporter ATP-binding protein [Candidatus Saccharibacteria bacterium]
MPRPKMTTEKPKNIKAATVRLVRALKPWRASVIAACIFAAGSTALAIFGPSILGNMTTDAVASLSTSPDHQIDWPPIVSSVVTLIILYIVSGLFSYLENYLIGRATAKLGQDLRSKLLAKISRLPISYFDRHQFGDTLSRMSNDIDIMTESLQNSLSETISNIVLLVGTLVMMLTISPLLSLVAVITIPISLIFVAKTAKSAQKHFHAQQNTLGRLNSNIEESYSGSLVIKTNSHEAASIAAFKKTNEELYVAGWKAQFFSSLAFPTTHFFTNLGYVAICVLGGLQVIAKTITIGDIQAFIQYVNQFNRPITSLAQITSTLQLTLAASERVFTFLDEPEEAPDHDPARTIKKVEGKVDFHHMSFAYTPDKPVIKNFTATIWPGQQVALVGPTGAGKTTVINLLMRFYDPTSGYITIDGTPIAEMKRSSVRALFGMVLQDTWLFSGTIEENLKYGNEKATHDEIVKACKECHVDHIIQGLPKGYKTKISEDSDNISAGEKQLLTIARAMIANPPMLILDEATSNVDTRTEQLIQDAMTKLTKGRTSFVIAHRLSTIRDADLILVMKEGNIVEQGTHTELLKQNGFYAELYNSQFAK